MRFPHLLPFGGSARVDKLHERFVPWLMEAGLDDEYEMTFRHTVRQYMTSQTVRTVVCFATLLAIFVPQC
jgi:hypothetical protein